MASPPIAITACGMVTGVGLDTLSTSAAIRAQLDNFQETAFLDGGGEPIQGCEVVLEEPWRGVAKLSRMLVRALRECVEEASIDLAQTPIMLCLAELERPGRADDLGPRLLQALEQDLGISIDAPSRVIEHGRVSGLVALSHARDLLHRNEATAVLVAGVDSLLSAGALNSFEAQERLLTSQNSNGFIPGEGAGVLLLQKPSQTEGEQLVCKGLGFAVEAATLDSEEPLRGDGLTKAVREAYKDAGSSIDETQFRMADVTGEQYWFKESSLVVNRLLRTRKEVFPLWHLTDSVGEVGAAVVMLSLSHARMAGLKGFADGRHLLYHGSNDDGKRGAAVLSYE